MEIEEETGLSYRSTLESSDIEDDDIMLEWEGDMIKNSTLVHSYDYVQI